MKVYVLYKSSEGSHNSVVCSLGLVAAIVEEDTTAHTLNPAVLVGHTPARDRHTPRLRQARLDDSGVVRGASSTDVELGDGDVDPGRGHRSDGGLDGRASAGGQMRLRADALDEARVGGVDLLDESDERVALACVVLKVVVVDVADRSGVGSLGSLEDNSDEVRAHELGENRGTDRAGGVIVEHLTQCEDVV
jgi:hypothetical protein